MSREASCQLSAVSYQLSALSVQWNRGAERVECAIQEMLTETNDSKLMAES